MRATAQTDEEGAAMLIEQAKKHLQEVHPDVHKTDEEVGVDIRTHMVVSQ